MSKSFLVGNFLSGYSNAFHFSRPPHPDQPAFSSDQLEHSFDVRANRFQHEQRRYAVGFQISLVLALLTVTGFFHIPFRAELESGISFSQQELVQIEEVAQTVHEAKPPPPPRPPMPVEVPNDEIMEDEDLGLDVSLDIDEVVTHIPPPPPPPDDDDEELEEEPEIFIVVEQMPELIGGAAKLRSDTKYPELARKAGVQGTVVVQIVVDAEGNPQEPQVVKSVAGVLDNAAVEAVMKQKFRPGMQRGRPVAVRMAMPVKFQLRGKISG